MIGKNIARRWTRRARKHLVALVFVLSVTAVGQLAIFAQRPLIVLTGDSQGYVRAATAFVTQFGLAQSLRTPAYAVVLALLFTLGGWVDYLLVVVAQTALIVVALVEIYALLWNVTRRIWLACCVASLLGANLYLLNWERSLLAEALTFVAVVTVLLCFERFVHAMRVQSTLAFALSAVVLALMQPFFLFLPALLLAALFARVLLARQQVRRKALYVALALATTYGCLSGYLVGQARAHGNLAPTWATNARATAAVPDIFAVWLAQPAQGIAASAATTAIQGNFPLAKPLLALSLMEQGLYWLFPLLLIVLIVQVRKHPRDPQQFMLLILALVVASTVVMAALDAKGKWYAVRFPVDWALIAVASVMVIDGIIWFYSNLIGRFVEI